MIITLNISINIYTIIPLPPFFFCYKDISFSTISLFNYTMCNICKFNYFLRMFNFLLQSLILLIKWKIFTYICM